MNKLYIWCNDDCKSDFVPKKGNNQSFFGFHSGGIVVLASSERKAKQLVEGLLEKKITWATEHGHAPTVLELDKQGIVLYADGDC